MRGGIVKRREGWQADPGARTGEGTMRNAGLLIAPLALAAGTASAAGWEKSSDRICYESRPRFVDPFAAFTFESRFHDGTVPQVSITPKTLVTGTETEGGIDWTTTAAPSRPRSPRWCGCFLRGTALRQGDRPAGAVPRGARPGGRPRALPMPRGRSCHWTDAPRARRMGTATEAARPDPLGSAERERSTGGPGERGHSCRARREFTVPVQRRKP